MLQSLVTKQPIIHLAFFHGIGVSQLALQYLNTNIIRTFSWEIDPFCNELLDYHYSNLVEHMGDITQTDFPAFCHKLAQSYDTNHIILITSAPPCKDHSRVRDTPPGLAGQDGSLIQQMIYIESTIRQQLPHHTIRSLMENVVPHTDIRPQFEQISNHLGRQPILVDAADGQVTSRPRLWWLDADWKTASDIITKYYTFLLTLDITRHLRQTLQSHRTVGTTVHTREKLGNTSHFVPTTVVSLPHHTSTNRLG